MTEIRPWTVADVDELQRLWLAGYRVSDICHALSRTAFSVRRRAYRMGLPRRPSSKLKAFEGEAEQRHPPMREMPLNARNRDEGHIALCQAEGGFPVLSINYPRKAA
jgi:hypothetical protein